jgi:hypothetical protein
MNDNNPTKKLNKDENTKKSMSKEVIGVGGKRRMLEVVAGGMPKEVVGVGG